MRNPLEILADFALNRHKTVGTRFCGWTAKIAFRARFLLENGAKNNAFAPFCMRESGQKPQKRGFWPLLDRENRDFRDFRSARSKPPRRRHILKPGNSRETTANSQYANVAPSRRCQPIPPRPAHSEHPLGWHVPPGAAAKNRIRGSLAATKPQNSLIKRISLPERGNRSKPRITWSLTDFSPRNPTICRVSLEMAKIAQNGDFGHFAALIIARPILDGSIGPVKIGLVIGTIRPTKPASRRLRGNRPAARIRGGSRTPSSVGVRSPPLTLRRCGAHGIANARASTRHRLNPRATSHRPLEVRCSLRIFGGAGSYTHCRPYGSRVRQFRSAGRTSPPSSLATWDK